MNEKTFLARTDNQKKLLIAQMNEYNNFLEPNYRYLLTLRQYQPGTSQAARGYYYNKIVPDFRKALYLQGIHKRKSEVDLWIRQNISPITIEETWTGKEWKTRVKSISELNNQELNILIFEIGLYAAEHLNFFIADPNTI